MPEPRLIDSVTVRVDGGPPVEATLTQIPHQKNTVVTFKALAQVTGGTDPHAVTITATNDIGISASETRSVFTGPVFEAAAPALLIDIISPFKTNPTDSRVMAMLRQMQQQLAPLASRLASSGRMLAGPNVTLATNHAGAEVVRLGIWIEDPGFPVLLPAPPAWPLPRLSDEAAAAGFALVDLLPVPHPDASTLGPAFAVAIPTTTLQKMIDAITPGIKAAASDQGVNIHSVEVHVNSPGSVTVGFVGDALIGIPFTVAVTETLGIRPLANADPPQSIPVVLGTSNSSSLAGIPDWFSFFPFTLASLVGAIAGIEGSQAADQVSSIMSALLQGIPSRVPFRNTLLPTSPVPLPDFPALVLNWQSLGVTGSDIVGTGTTMMVARDQSMVGLTESGTRILVGYQNDMAGGAGHTYEFRLVNLAPDQNTFRWHVSGTGDESGPIDRRPFDQGGTFQVVYPLPLHVKPGTFPFVLSVEATETCGTDPNKTLHASLSLPVKVQVLKNPVLPPVLVT